MVLGLWSWVWESTTKAQDQRPKTSSIYFSNVWPLLAAGTVKPLVHCIFPLELAADAHRALESGAVIGKVVLTT